MALSTDGTNHFIGNLYNNDSTLQQVFNDLPGLMTASVGADNFKVESSGSFINHVVDWRPNISEEMFTSPIPSFTSVPHPTSPTNPSNYARFSCSFTSWTQNLSYFYSRINTNNTNDVNNNVIFSVSTAGDGQLARNRDLNSLCWVTADDRSLTSFSWNKDTNIKLFVWTGVTKDNQAGFEAYPTNCCTFAVGDDGTNSFAVGSRAAFVNSSIPQSILTTGSDINYAIACKDSQTPGSDLWVTDFWLIDDDSGSGNPGSGRCSNLLLAKGASFEIGKVYSLNTPHVDGGSNIFLCVANWGTDKILMRVTNQ